MTNVETIYSEYHGKVLGYLTNKVNNQAVAEDLCSEVFLKVVDKIDSYDEQKASLSTWIYCITRNTLYDYFRTQRDHAELDETLTVDEDFVEKLCTEQMLERLADALETLTPRERKLIIDKYYRDTPLKEIAEQLDVSYSYVKIMHKTALAKLSQFFEKKSSPRHIFIV